MGGSTPKKAKTGKTTFVFWDWQGVMLIDYLEKGKTISVEYYVAVLE